MTGAVEYRDRFVRIFKWPEMLNELTGVLADTRRGVGEETSIYGNVKHGGG